MKCFPCDFQCLGGSCDCQCHTVQSTTDPNLTYQLKGNTEKVGTHRGRLGALIFAVFNLAVAIFISSAPLAHAASLTAPAQSEDTELRGIIWKDEIPLYPSAASPNDPTFAANKANISYVAYRSDVYSPETEPMYRIYILYRTDGQKVKISKDWNNTAGKYVYTLSNGLKLATIQTPGANEQAKIANPSFNCASTDPYPTLEGNACSGYVLSVQNLTTPVNNRNQPFANPVAFELGSVITAVNVTYDPSFDGTRYSSEDMAATAGGVTQCGTWDIGCQIRSVAAGITGWIGRLFSTIASWWVSLFMPSQDFFSNKMNDIKTAFINQLGFLAFPFDWIAQLFGTTDSFSCSQSSCIKNFGNIYGAPFSINFAIFPASFPRAYATAQLAAQGVISFAVIYMLYRKIIEVLGGDSDQ